MEHNELNIQLPENATESASDNDSEMENKELNIQLPENPTESASDNESEMEMENKELNIQLPENPTESASDNESEMENKELNIQLPENPTESASDNDSGNQMDGCGSSSSIENKELEAFANMLQMKDNRIKDLEDKLSELKKQLCGYQHREHFFYEREKRKGELLEALTKNHSSIRVKFKNLVENVSNMFASTYLNLQKDADECTIESLKATIADLESKAEENDKQLRSAEIKLSKYEDTIGIFINYGTSDKLMNVPGIKPFLVTTEDKIVGPGWVVIQRRIDGTVDFNRDYTEYQEGFGNPYGEFWLGLEKLHRITNYQNHNLYISVVDYHNKTRFAQYDSFAIGSKDEGYNLKSLGKFYGNAGDCMRINENKEFSICPKKERGWWDAIATIQDCNPNGKFSKYQNNDWNTLYWGRHGQRGEISCNILSIQMLIKPSTVKGTVLNI